MEAQRDYVTHQVRTLDELARWTPLDDLCAFLHENLKPYEDTVEDIRRGVLDALAADRLTHGFVLLAMGADDLIGGVIMLNTGMRGYVPPNLLLFIAVRADMRGRGLGTVLVRESLALCDGPVKLHVEYENPAKRLYERVGFTTKYAEMRWEPPSRKEAI